MLPITLAVRPSVDTQSTPLQVSNGMTTSNLIRVKNGLIQKLGGSTRVISTPFNGVATALLPWDTLNGTQLIGIGTTQELDLISAGSLVNITPAAGVGSGQWSLGLWGQNLVGVPAGSRIVQWVPPVAGGNIAQPLANAPVCNGLVVAAPAQQIIAWGAFSVTLGMQDPMLMAWCDVANNTSWTATATNQAGTFRLPTGSQTLQVLWYGISGLIWTDIDLYSMTYAGFPLVYGFNRLAPNCGSISSRAAGSLGTLVSWMSNNDFFLYQGGQVQTLTCTVRDFVFNNLDRNFLSQVHCDTNTYFGEFMWRFPTIGSGGVCNAYVKWSPYENSAWDKGFGLPNISAWSDQKAGLAPIGADYGGLVQQFETATDFDGVTIDSSFLTGWFNLAETEEFLFVERILPDFVLSSGGQVQITVEFADQIPPTDTDYPTRIYGPYQITSATPYFIVRGRGRVARLLVECIAPNTFWRYGKPEAVVSVDGRR